jgi:hypothetical protein
MLYDPALLKAREAFIPVEAPAPSEPTVPVVIKTRVLLKVLSTIWNIFGKLSAVPTPIFDTVAEKETLLPVVKLAGPVVSPAVRSGEQLAFEGGVEEQDPSH